MNEGLERSLIHQNKEDLDKKHNKCCRPTILAKKCERCGKIHPIIKYYWGKSIRDGLPSLKINIQAPDGNTLDEIFKTEDALHKIGIHFDTGYGGSRDWEFNWSLTGEHYVFDEEKKEYVKVKR